MMTGFLRPASTAGKRSAAASAHQSAMPHWLVHLGGLGLFAVAIADSSPIPLPLPGSTDVLLLLLVARRGNPFLLVGCAVLGSAVGGFLTWAAGRKGGEAFLERSVPARFRKRLERWATDHTVMSISVAAMLPPPVPLTPFLLAAGALAVPRNRFMAALIAARLLRYGLVAWAAATYGRIVLRWWTQNLSRWSSAILWTFIVLLVASIGYGIWQYRRQMSSALEAAPSASAS